VEWVETTGKSLAEAKDAALDRLGVDEDDAEFEVLEEPKSGLFGRVRREARVRARVQPKSPPPKADRRDRRRRANNGGRKDGEKRDSKPQAKKGSEAKPGAKGGGDPSQAASKSQQKGPGKAVGTARASKSAGTGGGSIPPTAGDRSAASSDTASVVPVVDSQKSQGNRTSRSGNGEHRTKGDQMSNERVSMDEQAEIIEEFLEGLMDSFGIEAGFRRDQIDDELLEVQVEASDLGLLIGLKGQTLGAIQELSRAVLQRRATGSYDGRVHIDIGGYRRRRRASLERFAKNEAEKARSSGRPRVFEPMGAADRKVIHDTINDLDGVSTSSEGNEPYRRVVVRPAD